MRHPAPLGSLFSCGLPVCVCMRTSPPLPPLPVAATGAVAVEARLHHHAATPRDLLRQHASPASTHPSHPCSLCKHVGSCQHRRCRPGGPVPPPFRPDAMLLGAVRSAAAEYITCLARLGSDCRSTPPPQHLPPGCSPSSSILPQGMHLPMPASHPTPAPCQRLPAHIYLQAACGASPAACHMS